MKRNEAIAKARDYLVPTSLLSDIVPAADGPVIVRAEGSLSFDTEGNGYLDFNSGQMCSALGHGNPRIQKVIEEQSKVLTHSSTVYYNVPAGGACRTPRQDQRCALAEVRFRRIRLRRK